MARYICTICNTVTDNPKRLCHKCREKVDRIRTIKAMLMPYYQLKQELQKRHIWEAMKAKAERERNG